MYYIYHNGRGFHTGYTLYLTGDDDKEHDHNEIWLHISYFDGNKMSALAAAADYDYHCLTYGIQSLPQLD